MTHNPAAIRRYARVEMRVLVDLLGSEFARSEYASSVGAGGLFLETEEPPELGSTLKLRFRLPGHAELQEIEGRVAWINDAERPTDPQTPPGAGIEFTDPSEVARLNAILAGSGPADRF